MLPPRRLQVSSLAAVALFVLMVTVGRRRNGEEDIAEYGVGSRRVSEQRSFLIKALQLYYCAKAVKNSFIVSSTRKPFILGFSPK